MRIGVNGRPFQIEEPGGAIQSAMNLTESLSNLSNHEIVLFGHSSIQEEFKCCQLSTRGFWFKSQIYGLIWEQVYLPGLVNSESVDVLLCPNANPPFRSVDIPVVVIIHDILNYLGHTSDAYKILQNVRTPRVLQTADCIITVSEFTKSELVDKLEVAESKINVVPNGIDDLFLSDNPGTPISVPDNYLLYVGGMHERKNIGGVISAFLELKEAGMTHELVLVGPGEKRTYQPSSVDSDTIHQRDDIHLMGFIPRKELKFVYRNADVFLYPSRYEGFGIPPLEAMASGTPVVASNTSAMPEVLDDAAILVNPEDGGELVSAIETMLDEDVRSEYIARGERIASEYTWERAGRLTGDILAEVAE